MGWDATSRGLDYLGRTDIRPITSPPTQIRSADAAARGTFKSQRVAFNEYRDRCEIQVNRGNGKSYVQLTVDPTSGDSDTK